MSDSASHDVMDVLPPALPVKSGLRGSRFLEPIDTKTPLDIEQPALSPSIAPHDVYLSSEEDASSSAGTSDYEFDSDSELSTDSPDGRRSVEDIARMVSIVFQGKPSIVELPARKSADGFSPKRIERTSTDPTLSRRRGSVSSVTSTSMLSTISRASTMGYGTQQPAFLSTDPFASPKSTHSERPSTPKGNSSMLKRTLSLARKRSKPALNQNLHEPPAVEAPERPLSMDLGEQEGSRLRKPRHQDILQASRNSTAGTLPVLEPEVKPSQSPAKKGHSRLRSGLSISMRRKA